MKCPKCGFTSFDYLDSCKKCGNDLSGVRLALGVIAISPDEMAIATPKSAAMGHIATQEEIDDRIDVGTHEEPETLGGFGDEELGGPIGSFMEQTSYAAAPASSAPVEEEETLDIDFGSSFSDEPKAKPAQPAPAAPAPEEPKKPKQEDEEFLDLDFGTIFEDEKK